MCELAWRRGEIQGGSAESIGTARSLLPQRAPPSYMVSLLGFMMALFNVSLPAHFDTPRAGRSGPPLIQGGRHLIQPLRCITFRGELLIANCTDADDSTDEK